MRHFRFAYTLATLALGAVLVADLGGVARAAQVPGVSGLNVTTSTVSDHTPVAITSYQWHKSGQGASGTNYIQCLNMRVLSRKAVTAVRFTMNFEDQFGTSHFLWNLDRDGSFRPGALWRSNYDSSHTYLNDKRALCFVVPTDRFDTGLSNITKLVISTSSVVFADGTTWRTGERFDQAYLPSGAAYVGGSSAAATPAPPPLNVAQNWADLGHSPIERLASSTSYYLGRPEQCVSFRNISDKVATDVNFSFTYPDASNVPLVTQAHDFTGTFTPPVEIDDKCAYVNLGSSDSIRRVNHVDIHVLSVVFQDGSQWASGQGFTRAYGNDGTPLGQRISVAPSAPFTPPNPSAPAQPYYPPGVPSQPYYPSQSQPYYPPSSQPYIPAPVAQPYAPAGSYVPPAQYAPAPSQLPFALIGLQVSYANAVDRIVPIYAPIGPGFALQQPVLGQAVGGTGGSPATFEQPQGYVLTGIDVYRGIYGGVDEVLGMKLYFSRLTSGGIDPSSVVTMDAMKSTYAQTFPTKMLRADPGTYISNIMLTPSTHSDGRTFVHDIAIVLTRI